MRRVAGSAAAVLAVALVLTVSACSGATKAGGANDKHVQVLRLLSLNGEVEAQLELYANAVARKSHGSLRIEIATDYRRGDPTGERDTIRDVQAGKAELAWVGARAWETVGIDSFRALVAPFLIDSYPLEKKVLAGPVAPLMLAGLRPHGLVGLALLPGPMRRIVGRKPLLEPRDFAGITFSTTPTPTAEATTRALGARPVVQIANVRQAHADGLESQLGAIAGNEFFRQEPYLTANVALWPRPLVVFANREIFDSLPPPLRRALRDAAHDVVASSTAAARQEDASASRQLCRAKSSGVKFEPVVAGPVDLAALASAVVPVYRSLERDSQTRSFIVRISALKRRLRAPAVSGPRCKGTATRQPTTVALLRGVYHQHVSVTELAAHDHVPASAVEPANYGDFVLVIDRNLFAFTQQNDRACTWQYGTFALTQDKLQETFIDGGGSGTSAYNKPGEHFVFRWSVYRGVLSLEPIVPTDLSPQRWTRVSSTASFGALGRRCPPPRKALP